MTKAPPACTKCWTPLPADSLNIDEFQACPTCNSMVRLEVFPAYFREIAKGASGEALLADTEASCFYHPQKQAVVVCAGCGRFVCSLCDVEFEGQHLCPPCLETAQKKGKIKSLESRRVLNDTIALHISIISFLTVYFSFILAPLALYWSIKHWKSPTSILHQSKTRLVVAIILAAVQLLILVGIILAIFVYRPHASP